MGGVLVLARQAGIAGHVSGQDRRQPALNALGHVVSCARPVRALWRGSAYAGYALR